MAPKTNSQRFTLTLRKTRGAVLSLLLLVIATLIPNPVSARALTDGTALPDLGSFISTVDTGDANTPTGAYAEGVFATPVMQQPTDNAGFVSGDPNSLTQFSLPSQYGNIGLLAHNDLSGQYFAQLMPGQRIQLVYGNGRIEYFRVSHVYRYQATSPYSMHSDFIDLDTQEYLTANGLFAKVYMGPRHITFQTCIAYDGNASWGRLFVIAEPEEFVDPHPMIREN
jgi:hypothetical protein